MSLDLRPLTLGELLDRSFRLFRRHFWLFVGLMALPSVLVLVLNVAMLFLQESVASSDLADVGPTPDMVGALLVGGFLMFALAIAYFVSYVVTIGATTVAVSELYLDRTPTISSAYAHVRGHIGRLTLLMILIVLRLFGLFLVCMIPFVMVGIALAVMGGPVGGAMGGAVAIFGMLGAMLAAFGYSLRYAVAVPALVLEPVSANRAIARSVALIRQNFWRTAVIVVFAMVITYAAMAIFQMPFMMGAFMAGPESSTAFWLNLTGSVSGAIGGAVTAPVMIVALAVLYYDLRIRKEGLDVQIMMNSLDAHPTPGITGPVPTAG